MQVPLKYESCVVAAIGLTLLFAACNNNPPGKAQVSGTVNWEGQPLANGSIQFFVIEDGLLGGSAVIQNGRFNFFSKPGKMRAEVSADRPNPSAGLDERIAPSEQYIPDRYNAKSELTAEVTLDGENHFDFSLTDKP